MLLTQLYDPAPEVCENAVRFLEEACEDKDVLQLVVEMTPTMDHLGELGHPLLLKYVFTDVVFHDNLSTSENQGFYRLRWVSGIFMMLATLIVRWMCGSMYDSALHDFSVELKAYL